MTGEKFRAFTSKGDYSAGNWLDRLMRNSELGGWHADQLRSVTERSAQATGKPAHDLRTYFLGQLERVSDQRIGGSRLVCSLCTDDRFIERRGWHVVSIGQDPRNCTVMSAANF